MNPKSSERDKLNKNLYRIQLGYGRGGRMQLEKFGGDSLEEMLENYNNYMAYVRGI
ncbi:MAG: hypothetical protein PHS15_02165 [Clostridiaceae bacterium]|nr:hypothetical protein [Clostridiaceae bacterium]